MFNADEPPRSRRSKTFACINFVNHSGRHVDVLWFDFAGKPEFMMHLPANCPTRLHPLNTFVGHPFEFRDRHTHERMHVDNQPIYWPQPFCILYNNQVASDDHPAAVQRQRRVTVRVHFPVRSLYETALWQVLVNQLLHCSNDKSGTADAATKADAELAQLELPHTMRTDMQAALTVYTKRRAYRNDVNRYGLPI